jgi:hypothetical protein
MRPHMFLCAEAAEAIQGIQEVTGRAQGRHGCDRGRYSHLGYWVGFGPLLSTTRG